MAGTFLKWLIPCLVTVAGGTALALAQTREPLATSLTAQSQAALGPQFSWAHVAIDGRDAVLSGTATTQLTIDEAAARLATVHGVRAVTPAVTLAEYVSPFPFAATLVNGVTTLSGGYPSDAAHQALLSATTGAADTTRLLSGGPDAAAFEAGARFGLDALKDLDSGEIRMADLSLSITGRAKSSDALASLARLKNNVPAGITLASLTIAPPLASPYLWIAHYADGQVAISGNTPDPQLADQLRAAVPATIPVSGTLALASGEPTGFAANTLVLLKSLILLESGEASIRDGAVTLSGAPATSAIADQVTAAIAAIGGTATLDPPRVADFALSVAKAGDKLAFSGFVPDAATKKKLAALPGADVATLGLGRGAPEQFAAGLDFGLGVLAHLGEGHFDLKGSRLSLDGRAASVAEFKAALAAIAKGAPQGLTLTAASIHPPVADPFTFTASKTPDGTTDFSGFVPDEAVRAALTAKIAKPGKDTADPADGAPDNFTLYAGKGLDVLALLDTGTLKFDGKSWSIEGDVDSAQKAFAADAAYSVSGLRTAGWTYAVHLPPAPVAAPLPIIAPYVWRAQKAAGGAVSFAGFAPAEAFQRVAKGRASGATDSTALGAGAPADFGTSALAGLDALLALDEGALTLNGTKWTLTGVVASAAARDVIQSRLTSQINAANWQVAIQARDAAPVVTPYLWSASKAADGSVELGGYLPNDTLKAAIASRAGTISRDSTAIASGEPAGFGDDLVAGLDALSHLATGKAAFDGSKWSLTGAVDSQDQGDAAIAALQQGSKGGALWTATLDGYAPPAAPTADKPASSSASSSSAELSAAPDVTSIEPSAPPVSSSEPPVAPSSSAAPPEPEPASAIDTAPPMPTTLSFEASRDKGTRISLKGSAPDPVTDIAAAAGVPADGLTAVTGLPADFTANAVGGIDVLAQLQQGRLGFDGARWWLRGKAQTATIRDGALASITALPNGAAWSAAIDLVPPLEACTDRVAAIAAKNAILFKAGSAALLPASLPVLDELAADLEICPKTYVHVQGHTDADGPADGNLALSVARAEAVAAALVERGVGEERLYAEGYGETDPVASNDTKDGKAKNRRIAFEISPE